MDIFEDARRVGTPYIKSWFQGGYEENGQLVVKNPKRNDSKPGSFKINLTTGAFHDYADPDCNGGDCTALYAWLKDISNYEAAQEIMRLYEPFWEPSQATREERKASWRQLVKGHKNAPELEEQYLSWSDKTTGKEIARWPLEIKVNGEWRVVMWWVRFPDGKGGKTERPYTLFSDGKGLRWQRKALDGLYPLYGLRDLIERPNAPVLLMEGQKAPSVVAPVLGEDWAVIGFAGGSSAVSKTDFEPLTGREVWLSFDGDEAGRKAIRPLMKKLSEIQAEVHIVRPPLNVVKGWDLADVVEIEGGGRDELLSIILKEQQKELAIKQEDVVDHRPTRLDIEVTAEQAEACIYNCYVPAAKGDGMSLSTEWMYWIAENDLPIRNSIKYDYTTGTKSLAYDSSELYDAHLEDRIRRLGIPSNAATRICLDKMKRHIVMHNSNYNRVADYVRRLRNDYPEQDSSCLDEFMGIFTFKVDKKDGQEMEDFEAEKARVKGLYRELFDIFFTRMHARVHGTIKKANGEYNGLIENDIVPILEGPQNIGKTTLCRWLACEDDLYIDLGSGGKGGFGSADTIKKVRGRLISEIGEMKIMKTSDSVETIKSFISMRAATVDIKYVESQRDIPMTSSFIGTSNLAQYLSDETGNRRFWPVRLSWIDKDYMSMAPDLPRRLHSYYSAKVEKMNQKEIFSDTMASPELLGMIDKLREEAMVTYSDYDVCIEMIQRFSNYDLRSKGVSQSLIERMAREENYPTRITQRGFRRAARSLGLVEKRIEDSRFKRPVNRWVYDVDQEIPF